MKQLATSLLILVAVSAASTAFAQESESSHYVLSGDDSERGAYREWIIVERTGAGVEVIRQTIYRDHTHIQMGSSQTTDARSVRVRLADLQSIVGRLDASQRKPDTVLEITLGDDGVITTVGRSHAGDSEGQGQLSDGVPASSAFTRIYESSAARPAAETESTDETDASFTEKGKHLLAVGRRELKRLVRKERDKLVYDGVKLRQTFRFSDYLHIGVGAGVRPLRPESRTPEQVASQGANQAWIVSDVNGSVRVPLSTTIPVGSVNIGVGFDVGARVNYQVTDLYTLPSGVRDVETFVESLKLAKERSFDLPLDAKEASALTVGAKRVFDGDATIAIRGHLSVGHEVADYDGVLRIGASARIGGFYRVRGNVRIAVTRLGGNQVRVRATRTKTKSRGVYAEVFVGAAVNNSRLREELEPALDYVDIGIVQDAIVRRAERKIEKVLSFKIRADADQAFEDEVDVAHTYDLNTSQAAGAYERAIRGDFRQAGELSTKAGTGVQRVFRIVKTEERTHQGSDLRLSVLLDAGSHKRVSFSELDVDDPTGQSTYELFRFTHNKHFDLFASERAKRLSIQVIRRQGPVEGEGPAKRSFHAVLDQEDPTTRLSEVRRWKRLLGNWGLETGAGIMVPEFRLLRSRYGRTHSRIEIGISERGLEAVLSASRNQAFAAYAKAFALVEGHAPKWATAAGRAEIERSRHDNNDADRPERNQLEAANEFVANLNGLANAATAAQRASSLKGLANEARFGVFDIVAPQRHLYTLAAILELAPRETTTIDASLHGERIRIEDGQEGESFRIPVIQPRD
jgi:hypothetical protein